MFINFTWIIATFDLYMVSFKSCSYWRKPWDFLNIVLIGSISANTHWERFCFLCDVFAHVGVWEIVCVCVVFFSFLTFWGWLMPFFRNMQWGSIGCLFPKILSIRIVMVQICVWPGSFFLCCRFICVHELFQYVFSIFFGGWRGVLWVFWRFGSFNVILLSCPFVCLRCLVIL